MTFSFRLNKRYKMMFSDTLYEYARKKPTISIFDEQKNELIKIASFNSKETFDWFAKMLMEDADNE